MLDMAKFELISRASKGCQTHPCFYSSYFVVLSQLETHFWIPVGHGQRDVVQVPTPAGGPQQQPVRRSRPQLDCHFVVLLAPATKEVRGA